MKTRFGDVVEIETKKGLAYALYTHRHVQRPVYGALIRIFDHLYLSRPENISDVARNPVRFNTFFPLQAAVNRGLVKIIGNIPVPRGLEAFPMFRSGLIDRRTKKVANWSLWDGEKYFKVGKLSDEQRKLSTLGVCNDTFLINRIESGWRPETDPFT